MTRRAVYLHIGAPKTGTTYLQRILWAHRELLESRGVYLPGRNRSAHFRAGCDLRGVAKDPADPRRDWDGAWQALADKVSEATMAAALISDERLAASTVQAAERAVSSFAPADVHVIYVTRDPAGLLSAAWQEHVKHGDRRTFDEWIDDILVHPNGAEWYWKVHDVGAVLRRWGAAVPRDRLHVVTLPPKGSAPDLLWRRFCSVLGVSPDGVDTEMRANESLGVAGAELVRQVNQRLPAGFASWHQQGIVRDVLANQVLAARTEKTPIRVDARLAERVAAYTDRVVADIKAADVDVIGDLGELDAGSAQGDGVPAGTDVSSAAVDGLAGLAASMGELRDDRRALRRELGRERAKRKAAMRRAVAAESALRRLRNASPWGRLKRRVGESAGRSRVVGAMLGYHSLFRRHRR